MREPPALSAAMLEALPDGVVVTDRAGDALLANRRFARLWSLPETLSARLDGADLVDWLAGHVVDAARLRRRSDEWRQSPEVEAFDTFELADGRIFERHAVPREADGRCEGTVASWRDVTDRARAGAVLQARTLAERTDRARSEFIARMSHELRTPLNAILGFSEVLQLDSERPLAEVQRERVGRIGTAGRHLLAMIDDLLDVACLEAGTLDVQQEAVDAAAALRSVRDLCAPQAAAAGVSLRLQPQRIDVGAVSADPARLHQVLLKLVSSAIGNGRPGGSVTLGLGMVADHVTLSVADDGAGMSPEQLERLFVPFGPAADDIGVGLVIARNLVELMEGTLAVQSLPGAGSTFTVRLPRAPAAATARDAGLDRDGACRCTAAEVSATTTTRRPARVLYIEDDEVNRVLMQAYLGLRPDLGLETADDGTTGVAAALDSVPDLLLIDMMLPDIDGMEVLAALKADAALGTVPCIAVSANALPEQITEALTAGFDDYLTKPLSAAGLLLAIDRWLAAGRLRAGDGAGGLPTMTVPEERCDSARSAVAAGGSGAARLGADRATALARPDPRVRRGPSAPAGPGRVERRPACCRLHESSHY